MAGRAPGWPGWYSQTQGKDPEKVRRTARYYDIENFATRIHCPVLVGVGLIDQVCPPAAAFAALDRIKSDKEIVVMPQSEHQETHNSQRAYSKRWGAWASQLRHDMPLQIKTASTATGETGGSVEKPAAASGVAADKAPEYLQPTRENYLKLAAETEAALQRDVLGPWFPRSVDNEHGGFYCAYRAIGRRTRAKKSFRCFRDG